MEILLCIAGDPFSLGSPMLQLFKPRPSGIESGSSCQASSQHRKSKATLEIGPHETQHNTIRQWLPKLSF